MNFGKLIEQLTPCMLQAGKEVMKIYESSFEIRRKKDGSPITEADQVANEIIVANLKRIQPNISVVSEENPANHLNLPQKKYFLVDPLDGTKEFLKRDGKGNFTINIALIESEIPVMGIVYAPASGRLFCGYKNGGAWEVKDGKQKNISVKKNKKAKLVAVASKSHRDQTTNDWLRENEIRKIISIGSSLKFCVVASGEADVYPRFGPTMEWDTAAGDAILRSAGGKVTTPDLSDFTYGKPNFKNGSFIAWGSYMIDTL